MENTAGSTTFKTPDIGANASEISKNPGGWFKKNLVKIIIALLVIGVLVEIVFGGMSLFAPSSSRNLNPLQSRVNEMSPARLSLIPDKTAYKKGEAVSIDVKLYTGGYTTASTDLSVKYDPAFLKPQGANFTSVGQIYPDYPPAQVDEKNGLIGISGIPMDSGQSFSGVGLFAKLNFTALKDGQTEVTIDYQPDQTGDSNVVLTSSSKDILGIVDNARIIISPDGGSDSGPAGQSCGSFTQYCQTDTGANGTQVCDSGIMKDGVCGYDPGLTTGCEVCKQ